MYGQQQQDHLLNHSVSESHLNIDIVIIILILSLANCISISEVSPSNEDGK